MSKLKSSQPKLLVWLALLLALTSLACSLGRQTTQHTVRINKILPTVTPTVVAMSPAVSSDTEAGIGPVEVAESSQNVDSEANPVASAPQPIPTPTTRAQTARFVAQPIEPTATRLIVPTATATLGPAVVSDPAGAVVQPTATSQKEVVPNPTATLPPPPPQIRTQPPAVDGWSFIGVRASIDYTDAIVVGELVNNTGIPQTDVHVSGTLFDRKNQIISDVVDTLSYVPVDIIPVGAHVPFELIVESAEPIYRLDLFAMSDPAGDPPRQNFEIANVSQWAGPGNMYCLGGEVLNSDLPLEDYLIILATTYTSEGNLVSFGEYSAISPAALADADASPFEMCIDPLGQQIAFHDVRAIGR